MGLWATRGFYCTIDLSAVPETPLCQTGTLFEGLGTKTLYKWPTWPSRTISASEHSTTRLEARASLLLSPRVHPGCAAQSSPSTQLDLESPWRQTSRQVLEGLSWFALLIWGDPPPSFMRPCSIPQRPACWFPVSSLAQTI